MGKRVIYNISSSLNITFDHDVEEFDVEDLSDIWDELTAEEQEDLIYDSDVLQDILNNHVEITARVEED